MNGLSVSSGAFLMQASVPEDLVGMPAEGDGDWAAWHGVTWADVDGRNAIVLVSITMTPFRQGQGRQEQGTSAADVLTARIRARRPGRDAHVGRFATAGGHPGVSVRRVVTQRVGGRNVTTGQAQAFVAYPDAEALGVVSGVALDPADLDRATELVTGIAAGMTITSAPAAA